MKKIEKQILKELYDDYNWPDVHISSERKIYGVDMSSSPSFKSTATIMGSNSAIIVDSKLGIQFNISSNFNNINNIAKLYKDIGLIE